MKLRKEVQTIKEVQYEAVENSGKIEKGSYICCAHFFVFNEDGNKAEESLADPDGSDASRAVYSYDKKGRRTEVNTYHPDGKHSLKVNSTFNKKGFEIERILTDTDGGTDNWKTLYKYDKKGKKLEEEILQQNSLVAKIFYKYDANGNVSETEQIGADGISSVVRSFKYDEKGNKVEMKEISKGVLKVLHTYEYEFDSNGNWIRQISYEEGKAIMVTEREISYFD